MNIIPGEKETTKDEKSPVYRQILDVLMDRIETGRLLPGDAAPSESDLIAEFKVSATTARRCLNHLSEQGLVTRIQGRGTYVSDGAHLIKVSYVGVIYHDLVNLTNSFSAQLLKGIESGLGRGNLQPVLLPLGQIARGANPAGSLRALVRRFGLKGLLLASPLPVAWLSPMLDEGMPMTAINFAYDDPRIDRAVGQYYTEVESVLRKARQMGHKRAVLLRGVFEPTLLEGVRMTPTPTPDIPGLELRVETCSYFDMQTVRQQVTQAMAGKNPPTLFVCWGYEAVLEAADTMQSLGWRVPQDISLIFVGVEPGPTRFTGVSVQIARVASLASARLTARLSAGSTPIPVDPVEAIALEGSTLATHS